MLLLFHQQKLQQNSTTNAMDFCLQNGAKSTTYPTKISTNMPINLSKSIVKMHKLGIASHTNYAFSQLTTLAVGGPIALTIFPTQTSQLVNAAKYLTKHNVPFCVLGKGSNILASDNPFDGVVIATKNLNGVCANGTFVTADCGTPTAKVAQLCVAKGLSGGEFLACLPASVGGVTICNAGCFGQCAQDIVHSVKVLLNGVIKTLSNKQCNFTHRNSIFKNSNYVILQVTFCFAQSTATQVAHKIQWMKCQKSKTQPLGSKTAGCVLYNANVPLSKLIDEAGLKGYQIGQAKVSKKHAGFVINIDKSSAKDIYLIIQYIQQVLLERYNVTSKVELNLLNFAEGTNDILPIHQDRNHQNSPSP